MHSEREHLEYVAGTSVRSRPTDEKTAAAPAFLGPAASGPATALRSASLHTGALGSAASLGSAAGNAALTHVLRGAVQRSELTPQGAGELDPEIGGAIASRTGGGSSLPDPVRADMEHHFGYDFSPVRVHTDSAAGELNRAVSAEAFTTGNDIFFSPGSFSPTSSSGRELLAHELTHVVQQSGGSSGASSGVSSPADASEVEARSVATAISSQQVVARHESEEHDEG